LIKSVEVSDNFGLRLSAGSATLVPDFDEAFALTGVTASFYERYSLFASYDGKSVHEGLAWIAYDWLTLSFLMIESEFPAFSIVLRR